MVKFEIAGNEEELEDAVDEIYDMVKDGVTIEFNGQSVTTTGDMWVDGVLVTEKDKVVPLALIIVICVVAAILIIIVVAFLIYYCKRRTGEPQEPRTEQLNILIKPFISTKLRNI